MLGKKLFAAACRPLTVLTSAKYLGSLFSRFLSSYFKLRPNSTQRKRYQNFKCLTIRPLYYKTTHIIVKTKILLTLLILHSKKLISKKTRFVTKFILTKPCLTSFQLRSMVGLSSKVTELDDGQQHRYMLSP